VHNRYGFTLVELMIVVVVIGILAALAIPNYQSMQDRAKESNVTSNAHTVQLSLEDYAVRNNGIYSTNAADILPLLPGSALLQNVFTGGVTEPQFGVPANLPGQIGVQPVQVGGVVTGYDITAFGKEAEILTIHTGD